MAARSALEMIKNFGMSFRRNWGLKLISLFFAVIMWNYVIVEVDPARQIPYNGVEMKPATGIESLNSRSLTVKGDISKYLKNVNVAIDLKRSEVSAVNNNNIQVWVDLSSITKEGKQDVRVSIITPRGTVKRISPETISVTVEKLVKRVVPVAYELTGDLPIGYWMGTPVLTPNVLTISGAVTDVEKVDRAVVNISLADLKENLSSSPVFVLQDKNENALPSAGLVLSPPNCIVNLQVLPTKTVRIDAKPALNGSVAKGYELNGDPETEPAEIQIAGPADKLKTIDVLIPSRIDLDGLKGNSSFPRTLELPSGVFAVVSNSIQVFVKVKPTMATKTLDNLPVSVTGLGPGLRVDAHLTASAIVTYAEPMASFIKPSRIHLHVDATGMDAGTHTLKIWAEADPETGVTDTDIEIKPSDILVTITSITP